MDIGYITTLNSFVIGGISVFLNILLIVVIYSTSLKIIGVYKYMIVAVTVLDIALSVVYLIASPTFAAVQEMSSVLIVQGGMHLPSYYAIALLYMFLWLLCVSIVTAPSLFVLRYLQICRLNPMSQFKSRSLLRKSPRKTYVLICGVVHIVAVVLLLLMQIKANFLANNYRFLRYMLLLPICASSLCWALIGFSALPTENDIKTFQMIALNINVYGNFTFLVAYLNDGMTSLNILQNKVTWAAVIYVIIIMVTTIFIMIYCAKCILRTVRESRIEKTQKLQLQLNRMLVAQFLVPFLFIHVPFYLCVLAPIFSFTTGEFSDYLPFLFAWSPAINPLIAFYFIGDYRKYLLRKLLCYKQELSWSNRAFATRTFS